MSRDHLIDLAPPLERAFLIAVDTGADDGWSAEDSLAELASLADTAGAEVVGAEWQRRRHVDPNWYLGKGKAEELRDGARRDRLHAPRRRRRAEPQPAARARGAALGQGPRPQRPHPRHLRPACPDPRGAPPGRAGTARVPAAAPDAPLDAPLADAAAASAPADPARPSSRPTGASSGTRIKKLKERVEQVRQQRETAGRSRDRRLVPERRHRGLHERRQVVAAQRAHRQRGRPGRGPALRDARPDEPPGEARRRPDRRRSPTRWASSTSCPTSSWTPSARRSRRSTAPTSSSRSWMARTRHAREHRQTVGRGPR